ncbi:LOW QUALITY PROTEIN: light-regulated protein 1, chloroplastic [Prosopis cineraria]|uniref:LOW QUALITY PROTEIN: light-regulated protein 1, chloroplastic n=1 Tax=Prosopis cineraria TaxID=364024 RepID=UPI00240F0E07|nr:LOW QUALITY PROTEIN: light-regulated protein 1, chloroplastic [Prosopis cineraria]
MQAALTFAPNLVPLTPSRNISQVASFPPRVAASLTSKRGSPIKAATASSDPSTVDYSSQTSVFPAEACETIGGEACSADIYPEVRLQPQPENDTTQSENVEREYLEYNDAKTVFQGEACDDLGGIFCEREYQRGVY